MLIRRPAIFAIIVLALLSVVACSKPAPPSGDAPESGVAAQPASAPASESAPKALPHACDLLTAKDAEAVLGPGATVKRDSEDTCDLAAANEFGLGPTLSVKIEELPDTWDGGDFAMSMDKDVKKLPEIGDGGYSLMGGSIVFKKGKAEVSVFTTNYKGALSKFEAAKLIANKVAAAM